MPHFSEALPSDTELVSLLQETTADLYWISESEAAFTVHLWPESPPWEPWSAEARLLRLTDHAWETPIKTVELADFFRPATQHQDWHEPADTLVVNRYQTLVEVLHSHLSDLKVYRVGTLELDIYIVGQARSGSTIALSTSAVET